MRRIAASVLCLLVLAGAGGSASAKTGGGAETARGAGASWWRHGANHGTLYYLDVSERAGTYGNRATGYRAYFGAMRCDVGRRNYPVNCNWRRGEHHRLKVDSFEIDPLMQSAHVVVHRGARRGEITWTGRGDYGKPLVAQSISESFYPPHFAQAHASVLAVTGRDARAMGDLFGLDLKRKELGGAGMYDIVYAGASACLLGPWC
jgi:hypothetical protein